MPTSLTYILLLGQRLLTSETCCGYWYGYIGLAHARAIARPRAHHTHFDFHGLFVRLQYAPQHRRRHSPCLDPSPTDLLPGRPTPSARPARARAPRPQPRRDAAALTAHTHAQHAPLACRASAPRDAALTWICWKKSTSYCPEISPLKVFLLSPLSIAAAHAPPIARGRAHRGNHQYSIGILTYFPFAVPAKARRFNMVEILLRTG